MVEASSLINLLDRLAVRFEDAAQAPDDAADRRGWGQFLDAPRRHRQTGPYGTSAGVLVLALADRGNSILATQAAALLRDWWANRDTNLYAHERLVQTVRLAFFNLAVRLSPTFAADGIRREVESSLLGQLHPSNMWGNFWVSAALHDPTPRLLPSAMVLLSFSLLRDERSPLNQQVMSAADVLEERIASSADLPIHEAAVAAAAILATKGQAVGRKALARIAAVARRKPLSLGERSVYFYDYEHSPDNEGSSYFGREYFIIPTEVLIGLSGLMAGAPAALRLRSETTLVALSQNLGENDGAYRPTHGDRLSSVDQAWSAIFLKVASLRRQSPRCLEKCSYALRRQRKENRFTEFALPAISMITVAVAIEVLADAGTLVRSFAAIAALIIGGLYGPKVFRKLF